MVGSHEMAVDSSTTVTMHDLPHETISHIIRFIPRSSPLRQCSLVNKEWGYISQSYLFFSVDLTPGGAADKLLQTIHLSPHIAVFIHEIHLSHSVLTYGLGSEILAHLPALRTLGMWGFSSSWNTFSTSAIKTLTKVIFPHLIRLMVMGIRDFPFDLVLSQCRHLKTLACDHATTSRNVSRNGDMDGVRLHSPAKKLILHDANILQLFNAESSLLKAIVDVQVAITSLRVKWRAGVEESVLLFRVAEEYFGRSLVELTITVDFSGTYVLLQ